MLLKAVIVSNIEVLQVFGPSFEGDYTGRLDYTLVSRTPDAGDGG